MEHLRALALTAAFILAVAATSQAWARVDPNRPIQSTQSIKNAVLAYLQDAYLDSDREFEVAVGHVDRRLRMPQCSQPIEAFAPPGPKRIRGATVGVRCTGEHPWKLYVAANVRIFDQVVVAARPLSRGDVLQAQDLSYARQDVSRLRATYYTDPTLLIGKHLKRDVSGGRALSNRWLRRAVDIRRGQRVVLIAKTAGLQVRMEGTALANAEIGQVVRVRNVRSKRIVEGVVQAAGVVNIPL